jgi:hypothetical protein
MKYSSSSLQLNACASEINSHTFLCSVDGCLDYHRGKYIVDNIVNIGMFKLMIHISPEFRIVGLDRDPGVGMKSRVNIQGILAARKKQTNDLNLL